MSFTTTAFSDDGGAFGAPLDPSEPPPDPPVNTVPPVIRSSVTGSTTEIAESGTAAQVLSTGTWEGQDSLAQVWFLNDVDTGATGSSVSMAAFGASPGDSLKLRVTGTNAGGSTVAWSNTLTVISA